MGAGLSVSKTFFSWCECWKRLQLWRLCSIMSSREVDTQQDDCCCCCGCWIWWASMVGGVCVWGGFICAGLGSLMTKQSFQLRPVRTCQSSGFHQPAAKGPGRPGLARARPPSWEEGRGWQPLPAATPSSFRGLPGKSHTLESPTLQQVPGSASMLEPPCWTCVC